MKEAALRGSDVAAGQRLGDPGVGACSVVAGKEFYEEFRETAIRVARDAAELVDEQQPGVKHEEIVVEGQAAKVLLEHSEDAELMVVGRRGHGSFREMLLGSISRQVVVHAKCPLVIVPSPLLKQAR